MVAMQTQGVPSIYRPTSVAHRRLRGGGPRGQKNVRAGFRDSPSRTCAAISVDGISNAVVILPGLGNSSEDYNEFKAELETRGFCCSVAQVGRPDWLRNAAGVVDVNYWRGTLSPRPTVDWYLERIEAGIAEAKAASGADRVSLVAHSAGGWMARVYLEDFGLGDVACLLSLGSPLNPVPEDVPGVIDQTRGILKYVRANCAPPAELDIPVVCVAGRYIEGSEEFSPDNIQSFVVGQGYKQVCGFAGVWGDGITPVESAHLEGAENITLEGEDYVSHTTMPSCNKCFAQLRAFLECFCVHVGMTRQGSSCQDALRRVLLCIA